MTLIKETISLLLKNENLESLSLESVTVSPVFTAVKLSNGLLGMARTENDDQPFRRKETSHLPGECKGMKVREILAMDQQSGFFSSIRLATINASSTFVSDKSTYQIIANCDPFDTIPPDSKQKICIVGAFHSYIQKSMENGYSLQVLELNPDAFTEETKHLYVPAEKYAEVFEKSEIIIITGSSIANNTIDDLLNAIPKTAKAILCGPSAGLLPELLFQRGVSIIGSTQILDPEKAMNIIAEGGAGYHLFRSGAARKICLLP